MTDPTLNTVIEFIDSEPAALSITSFILWARSTHGLEYDDRKRWATVYKRFIRPTVSYTEYAAQKEMMKNLLLDRAERNRYSENNRVWKRSIRKRAAKDHEESPKHGRTSPATDMEGEGMKEGSLHTEDTWTESGNNISSRIIEYRRNFVEELQNSATVWQTSALNYIFTKEFLLEMYNDEALPSSVEKMFAVEVKAMLEEADSAFIESFAEKAANSSQKDFEELCFGIHQDHPKVDRRLRKIFANLSGNNTLWKESPKTEQSLFDCIVNPILRAVFGDVHPESSSQAGMKMPVPSYYTQTLFPDEQWSVKGLVTMVSEGKRDNSSLALLKSDRRKLFHLQKLALDLLLVNGVAKPKVLGLLVQEGMMEFFVLSLEYEALYIVKEIGKFTFPRDNTTFRYIEEGLNILLKAREILEEMSEKVNAEDTLPLTNIVPTNIIEREGNIRKDWMRPSFDFRKG